jgi:hypothetical protein
VTILLAMKNAAGVMASLIADDDVEDVPYQLADHPDQIVRLRFRVVTPGQPPREEDFGPEGKANRTEILDLIDGLCDLLTSQGFAGEEKHEIVQ